MSRIVVFTGSRGYRHESTGPGGRAVAELATDAGAGVVLTDDPTVFEDSELDSVDAVVWMQTSGTGNLDGAQRAAYERFTAAGGGFAGVHATADGERDWRLFSRLVGARFAAHPPGMSAAAVLRHASHPSVDHLPERWSWTDEWYAFDLPPDDRDHRVLLALDTTTLDMSGLAMPDPHPLAWSGAVGPARTWYTALGHDAAAFDAPDFRRHLWSGIESVLDATPAPTREPAPTSASHGDRTTT